MNNKQLSENLGREVMCDGIRMRLVSAEKGRARLKMKGKPGYVFAPTSSLRQIRKAPVTPSVVFSAPKTSLEDKPIVTEVIRVCLSREYVKDMGRPKQKFGTFMGYTKDGLVRVLWDDKNVTERYHPSFVSRAYPKQDNPLHILIS